MPFKPVDQAIKVIVGPLIDDSDFKSREESIAYNAAGMEIDVIMEKADGTVTTTAVTPTSGGLYDWAHTDQGYYELELPASAGGDYNNTEEGTLTVVGYVTGVLPFRSPTYNIVPEKVWNALIEGSDNLEVDALQLGGSTQSATDLKDFADTGYDPSTHRAMADLRAIIGTELSETSAGYLAAAFKKLFDVATPLLVASDVMRGTDGAALAATALSTATWTNDLATSLTTLAGHDPGATIGTSTLTQAQVTGGAYAIDTDENGRVRIVDGTEAGELETTSGKVDVNDKTGFSLAADQSGVTIGTVSTLSGHTPQTGDSYAVVTNGTYGLDKLARTGADGDTLETLSDQMDGISPLDAAGIRSAIGLASANLDTQLSALSGYVDCLPATLDGSTFDSIPDMATATNQGAIAGYIDTEVGAITDHLTDIKGTGFAKDTHSLPQCLTATGFSTHSAADVYTAFGTGGNLTTCATATGFSTHSAADVANAVWDEAIADHTTGTTFGGKNQKAVPSETIGDYHATGFSTFNPASDKVYLANGAHGGAAASFTLSDYSDFQGAGGADAATIYTYFTAESRQDAFKAVGFSTHDADAVVTALGTGAALTDCHTATGFSTLDAAGVRSAVGLGSANLDTQLSGISGYVDCLPATLNGSTFTSLPAVTTDAASRTASKANVSSLALEATLAAMKGTTFDTSTDSLEAIRDRGDNAWTTGAGSSAPTVDEIRAEMDSNSTQLAAIVEDTNELQANQGNWITATGFSTHSAADVKTAMEADGSKLDHLWETTEDDGGTRRFTENALEKAPSGTGGDATETKQDTIISHLTDVKGTGFVKDTHSLPQCLTTTIATANVTFTPVTVTVSAGTITDNGITQYQHAAFGPFIFTITDDDDEAVDLSESALTFAVYNPDDPSTVLWSLTSEAGEITVSGDDNNQVTISDDDTHTASAGIFRYVLWDTTNDYVRARGVLTICREADVS